MRKLPETDTSRLLLMLSRLPVGVIPFGEMSSSLKKVRDWDVQEGEAIFSGCDVMDMHRYLSNVIGWTEGHAISETTRGDYIIKDKLKFVAKKFLATEKFKDPNYVISLGNMLRTNLGYGEGINE